jgi:diguanylate cyclase (GGDEF)-like protein
MESSWARIGPREEERLLAGKVAGALWLTVLPMLSVGLLLPGTVTRHVIVLVCVTVPTAAWGLSCFFFIDWERVRTPLYFHVPALLALPYIALLVASTGETRSPFMLTLLMLLAFCAYFFPPRVAVPYLVGCLLVDALPLAYDTHKAVAAGQITEAWTASLVFASVGGVIMVGKRELLSLRDMARDLSLRDSLTGLLNRRAFTDLLESHNRGGRRGESVGLLLLDLDDFKEANTLHGLPGGDRVLCAVAEALLGIAHEDDVVIRLGGDEFAIVTFGMSRHSMKRLADKSLESVRDAALALELADFRLSASAGWALSPDDADSANELMKVADLALRAAKMNGKSCAQAPIDWVPASAEV